MSTRGMKRVFEMVFTNAFILLTVERNAFEILKLILALFRC